MQNKKWEIKNESGVSGTAQDTTKNENKRKEWNNVDTWEETKSESKEPEIIQTTEENNDGTKAGDGQSQDEDEDLPDWLRWDIDPDATTQFTEDLKKMEEERQAKIKEFEEAQKKEQEEQWGIDGDTNETASPRKPASPDTP